MFNFAEIPVNYGYLDRILNTLLTSLNDTNRFLNEAKKLKYVHVRAAVPKDAYEKLIKNAVSGRKQQAIAQINRIRHVNHSFQSVDELAK